MKINRNNHQRILSNSKSAFNFIGRHRHSAALFAVAALFFALPPGQHQVRAEVLPKENQRSAVNNANSFYSNLSNSFLKPEGNDAFEKLFDVPKSGAVDEVCSTTPTPPAQIDIRPVEERLNQKASDATYASLVASDLSLLASNAPTTSVTLWHNRRHNDHCQ